MVTAGHCGRSGESWRLGQISFFAPTLGTGQGNGFFGKTQTYCDCQAVGPLPSPFQTNDTLDAFNNVQPEYSMPTSAVFTVPGQMFCFSGATTNGVHCGIAAETSLNYFYPKDTDGGQIIQFMDQVRINGIVACKGDSGSPITVGNTWAGVLSTIWGPSSPITTSEPQALTTTCSPDMVFSKLLPNPLYAATFMSGMMTW